MPTFLLQTLRNEARAQSDSEFNPHAADALPGFAARRFRCFVSRHQSEHQKTHIERHGPGKRAVSKMERRAHVREDVN